MIARRLRLLLDRVHQSIRLSVRRVGRMGTVAWRDRRVARMGTAVRVRLGRADQAARQLRVRVRRVPVVARGAPVSVVAVLAAVAAVARARVVAAVAGPAVNVAVSSVAGQRQALGLRVQRHRRSQAAQSRFRHRSWSRTWRIF